jgi:hypothetical protein
MMTTINQLELLTRDIKCCMCGQKANWIPFYEENNKNSYCDRCTPWEHPFKHTEIELEELK